MTESANIIERRKDRIIKTFASRINFVKEQGVYEKLKGTGLAPELIAAHDGVIELRFVEGENFLEYFMSIKNNLAEQAKCFEMFFNWYKQYRKVTNIALGEIDFDDFIIDGDRLICLDFEHCKPGSAEEDIARFASLLAIYPKGYTAAGLESAKLFICIGAEMMSWQPDLLAKYVPICAKAVEEQLSLRSRPAMAEFMAAYFTTAGVVLAGGTSSRMNAEKRRLKYRGRTMVEISASLIAVMPSRFISVGKNEKFSMAGFTVVNDLNADGGALEGIVRCLQLSDQPWTLFLACDMPLIPKDLLKFFLSSPKDEADACMFTVGGEIQPFPLLLRTASAGPALSEALAEGDSGIAETMQGRLRVKTIRAEKIRGFDPSMFKSVESRKDFEDIDI